MVVHHCYHSLAVTIQQLLNISNAYFNNAFNFFLFRYNSLIVKVLKLQILRQLTAFASLELTTFTLHAASAAFIQYPLCTEEAFLGGSPFSTMNCFSLSLSTLNFTRLG